MEAERQLKEIKRKNMNHLRETRGRREDQGRRDEIKRIEALEEVLQESYASAARARRSKERPKSMGFKTSFLESMKQRRTPFEDNTQLTVVYFS